MEAHCSSQRTKQPVLHLYSTPFGKYSFPLALAVYVQTSKCVYQIAFRDCLPVRTGICIHFQRSQDLVIENIHTARESWSLHLKYASVTWILSSAIRRTYGYAPSVPRIPTI